MAEVKHRCSLCPDSFRTIQGLRGHERLKHGVQNDGSAVAVRALTKGTTTTTSALGSKYTERSTERSNRVLKSSTEAGACEGDRCGISFAGRMQQVGQALTLGGGLLWIGSALLNAITHPEPPKELKNGDVSKALLKLM